MSGLSAMCGTLFMMVSAYAQLPKESLTRMGSDQFSERQKGYDEIKKWSVKNLKNSPETLYAAWKKSEDPEVKTRCYTLMKEVLLQRKFGRGRGFVGVRMDDAVLPGKPGEAAVLGVRIIQVLPDTPGQKAGLIAGDVVIGVDKVDFNKAPRARAQNGVTEVFSIYIQSKQPDDVITLHIMRAGKKIDIDVKLMLRPAAADNFGDPFGRRRENERNVAEKYFADWLKKMGG